MPQVTTAHYIVLSALLFAIGLFGVVTRKNVVVILMGLELMLNAANLAFVAFSRHHGNLQGQVFTFFVIAVAAAEAAVALSILMALFRLKGSVTLDDATELKG
ncbi:MAG: NADH-quinone oxidoreductase subunit NuoK [Planctomycetes bacterium]|nr:NADH-quinone oxidoreductase subunit NuoK [Planctomycetota bacterium]